MPKSSSEGSRADAVMRSLRTDILAGRLEPGRRLTFPELCSTYSVSVGVLREALVRLVDHGIVRTESNLGFSVMRLSDEDLIGLTAVRAIVEPGFVHQAVTAGSVQWEAQLVAAHHVLERTPLCGAEGLDTSWLTAHADFHTALVAGAGNRRLIEITRRLRQEADLYRRWYTDADLLRESEQRMADDHRELLAAALARDAVNAERLIKEQIEGATRRWLSRDRVELSA